MKCKNLIKFEENGIESYASKIIPFNSDYYKSYNSDENFELCNGKIKVKFQMYISNDQFKEGSYSGLKTIPQFTIEYFCENCGCVKPKGLPNNLNELQEFVQQKIDNI